MSNTQFVLRTVVLAIAGSILVFLLVGLLLADSWEVKSTRTIAAKPAVIAERVTDLSRWAEWCTMDFKLGNPTERTVEGDKGAAGQVATWRGPKGLAVFKLTRVDGGTGGKGAVDYMIGYKFGPDAESFGGKFTGTVEWQPAGEGTDVTWIENGELDSLVMRWSNWFGALQDKVQQVQRASLAGLDEDIRRKQDKAPGEQNTPEAGAPK